MKLKNSVLVGLLASLFLLAGCGDKGDTIIQGGNASIYTENLTIDISKWGWNKDEGRYEYSVAYKELTDYVYDKGAVIAHLYTVDGNVDVLKNLPYEKEYWDDSVDPNYLYSERISFDITPGYVTFFIENSDKIEREEFLATYTFKVAIVWSEFD